MEQLSNEWGNEELKKKLEQVTKDFVETASEWIMVRKCETVPSSKKGFQDILEGSVPPSEAIALDVAKAVAGKLSSAE